MTSQVLQLGNLRQPASDVDLTAFNLEMRNKAGINLVSSITAADLDKTIEGASSITVAVNDNLDRTIERSGKLGRKVDVKIDGLWWTLVAVKKTGRTLTLVFEEREINVLRYYNSILKADRTNTTRAQFVERMLKEVKEVKLKYYIPELTKVQKISDVQPNQILVNGAGETVTQPAPVTGGIPSGTKLTVKGQPAVAEQTNNADLVLNKGVEMGASRKVLVSSIMTGITESQLKNLTGGDRDSVGVFQQRPSQGWPASRDVPTDAAAYFQQAISVDRSNPNISYAMLCQTVQRSAFADGSNYAAWQSEAELFVTYFGVTPATVPGHKEIATGGGTVDQNNQQSTSDTVAAAQSGTFFMRGQITQKGTSYLLTKEDSWTCIQRLASEVGWRAFCVNGVIWFVSETYLFKSKPSMTISEDSPGIDNIDYDYDEGKRKATVTVSCHISRWSAPPGSIIRIEKHGVVNGRWLVNDVARSLFNTDATITLVKPLPVLPEPTSLSTLPSGFTGESAAPAGARNSAQPSVPQTQIQASIVAYAQSQLGLPYRWGAELPGVAFDCSGLTEAAYNSVGIDIPRVAQAQYDAGPKLGPIEQLQPGDLVFFGNPSASGGLHHVAIYIGNGSIIHAPHTGDVVRIQTNFMSAFSDYYGATRPWQR